MLNQQIEETRVQRGKRYKAIRERADISISYMQRLSGVSRAQIYHLEDGSTAYTIDTLIRYLHGLKEGLKKRKKK